jgi:hypothetical protein
MSETLKFIDDEGSEKDDSLYLKTLIGRFNKDITETNYSVYSLTGDWGAGKTTFIKLWEATLPDKNFIHIDAFEMDYETEPFIMLVNNFYKFYNKKKSILGKLISDFRENAGAVFVKPAKILGKAGLNMLAAKIGGNETAQNLISDLAEAVFDELVPIETEETSLYEKLRNVLSKIMEKLETPLYVVIDELDRCRPTFALETLEKIKHIFQVKNIKFILVYNEYILESIIEKTYGISNGNRYLEKFIQKPLPFDNSQFIHNWFLSYLQSGKEKTNMRVTLLVLERDYQIFSDLQKKYKFSLRDFQFLFAQLYNYHNISYETRDNQDLLVVIGIELLKILDSKKYIALKNLVENNQNIDVESKEQDQLTFVQIVHFLKSQPSSQKITDIFKKCIQGYYF